MLEPRYLRRGRLHTPSSSTCARVVCLPGDPRPRSELPRSARTGCCLAARDTEDRGTTFLQALPPRQSRLYASEHSRGPNGLATASLSLQGLTQHFLQLDGSDRLDEVAFESGRSRRLARGMLDAVSERDETHILQDSILVQQARDIVTTHVRKLDIEENDPGEEFHG